MRAVRCRPSALETVAREAIVTVQAIKTLLLDYKHRIRERYRFYGQDLINNLFSHPYTKIEFIQTDLNVSRLTATKYPEALTAGDFLEKRKVGRSNYYINERLYGILTGETGEPRSGLQR
jgi:Fic family protein